MKRVLLPIFPLVLPSCLGLLLVLPAWAQQPGTSPPPATAVTTPATVLVERFVVSGNQLLPEARVQAALAPFLGQRTPAELREAARTVQGLYRDAGYGAVLAFLPEQAVGNNTVRIEVVEGKIGKVRLQGNQQFSNTNILRSLPDLVAGSTPAVKRIDAQVQLANENPSKNVQVLLQPGEQVGEVDAQVFVAEQPLQRWLASLDNSGSDQTGRWRASLSWQHANLWDMDHVVSLQLQTAPEKPEQVAVLSAAYHAPLYPWGLTLDLFGAYSDIDGGSTGTAAGSLQFSGRGQVVGGRISRNLPRQGEIDQRLSLGLEHRDYLSQCSIVGLPAGACGPAGESVSVQPLSLGYTLQGPGRGLLMPFTVNLALHHNLQLGGSHGDNSNFNAVRPGAEPRYTLLRWSLQSGLQLPAQWQLQGRLLGQVSASPLVPGEQFGLGGVSTLRGYEDREVIGDSGAAAMLELQTPSLGPVFGLQTATLRAVAFVEAGRVQNRLGTPCLGNAARCSLVAVGVGLRGGWGGLQWRIDLAQALRDAALTRRNDTRAHLSLDYSF